MKLQIEENVEIYENEELLEGSPAAALLTIKNQLMKTLGNAFKFVGGSTVPKFTVQPKDNDEIAFEITTDGKNVECTPKVDGTLDNLHKKRGIAFMRAANVITDFIKSFIDKAPVKEGIDMMNEYVESNQTAVFDDFMDKVDMLQVLARTIKHDLVDIYEDAPDLFNSDDFDLISSFDNLNFKLDQAISNMKKASNSIKDVHVNVAED